MIVALHVHTNHSACSESRVDQIAKYCRTHGIDAIAITDHNDIEGALELQGQAPDLKVIVGEEVSTKHGEVIGLFLQERIAAGRSLGETCLEIKRQGGLVYIPHPFDRFKLHRIHTRHLMEILDHVDIVEIHNAKASLNLYNMRARGFALRHGKLGAVGSDSHYVSSIGSATNIMEPFSSPSEFMERLRNAEFRTGAASLLATWWVRVRKLVGAH